MKRAFAVCVAISSIFGLIASPRMEAQPWTQKWSYQASRDQQTPYPEANELVITFGGDVNFNRTGQRPEAGGARKYGRLDSWSSLSAGIAPLIQGDINFINLETIVTNETRLRAARKKFVFQSHGNSLKHLKDLGVNLVSAANNHAYDYGYEGYEETLKHLRALDMPFAGIGLAPDLFKPTEFEVKGLKIAFNAISFLSHSYPAMVDRVGMLNARRDAHWQGVVAGLAKSKADIKILSMHYGIEKAIHPEYGMRKRFLEAIDEAGISLFLGHHPHVARAIERPNPRSALFYSLGNFLMLGARDMGPLPSAQDYGLFGRAYFSPDSQGRWTVTAVEAFALTNMHHKPRPLPAQQASSRLKALNRLSQQTAKDQAVRLQIRSDGSGLACFSSLSDLGPRAKILCDDILRAEATKNRVPPKPIPRPDLKAVRAAMLYHDMINKAFDDYSP